MPDPPPRPTKRAIKLGRTKVRSPSSSPSPPLKSGENRRGLTGTNIDKTQNEIFTESAKLRNFLAGSEKLGQKCFGNR